MTIRYDQEIDTLTITLGPDRHDACQLKAGDFAALVGSSDELVSISIANASRFVARSTAAGVKVEAKSAGPPAPQGLVWHNADSSMVSAFAYHEPEGILEVAFHRTGVYRYFDVPLHIFEGLRDAASKGRFMRSHIINVYAWEKKHHR